MKICIRDDDLCFWSDYHDFIKIYNSLEIPVSTSVTPFAVSNHGNFMPFGDKEKNLPVALEKNIDLVANLKKDIKSGKVDVLLHGYNHSYLLKNGHMIPEMIYKTKQQLSYEIKNGKEYIENLLETKINVFVAPSQLINKLGISILEENNLHFSGMANRLNERKISLRLIVFLLKKFFYRFFYGYSVQGLMKYKNHIELGVLPILDIDSFVKIYKLFKRKKWPLILVTHYWELNKDNRKFENLKKIVDYDKKDGCDFCHLSDLFK